MSGAGSSEPFHKLACARSRFGISATANMRPNTCGLIRTISQAHETWSIPGWPPPAPGLRPRRVTYQFRHEDTDARRPTRMAKFTNVLFVFLSSDAIAHDPMRWETRVPRLGYLNWDSNLGLSLQAVPLNALLFEPQFLTGQLKRRHLLMPHENPKRVPADPPRSRRP